MPLASRGLRKAYAIGQPDGVTLRRVECRSPRLALAILQAELEAGDGPLPPRLQPVDLHAHLTRQRRQ